MLLAQIEACLPSHGRHCSELRLIKARAQPNGYG